MKRLSSLIIYVGIVMTIFGITYSTTDEYFRVVYLIGVVLIPIIAFYLSKVLNSKDQTYNPFLYGVFLFPMLSAFMNGFLIYDIGWAVILKYGNAEYSYTTLMPLSIAAISFIMYFIMSNRFMHKVLKGIVYSFLTGACMVILFIFIIMLTIGGV